MSFLIGPEGEVRWLLVAAIAAVSLFLSAFFSGSETGFMSVSRVRLRRQGKADTATGRQLQEMLRNIETPILTCLIGTNLFNVLISAVLTVTLTVLLGERGELAAVGIGATLVITFGEILPKVLYREFPEGLTLPSVRGIRLAMVLTWPVRQALLAYTGLWKRLLPRSEDSLGEGLDRRSLAALLMTNNAPNVEDRRFADLMDRYLELENITLGPIMRRLDKLVTVGPESTVRECLDTAARHGFSRLPITREDGRQLQAYLLVRDLLFLSMEEQDQLVPRKLWRSFLLVDVRMSPYELFEELRSQNAQLAVVTDPRGNLLGMITLEDLIETVIGSIHDEFDRDHRTRRMIDERNATQQA
jgi:putative hemolysin